MLIATFNALTGWAGRQITWQDERFILDGYGVITAADVMGYDGQGQLDWPSEEMRSWAAARLSWEQSVAAPRTAAVPAAAAFAAQPVVPTTPITPETAALATPETPPAAETAAAEAAADPAQSFEQAEEASEEERAAPASPVEQPAAQPADEIRDVLAPGGDVLDVVGTAPYQEALQTIADGTPDSTPDLEKWAHLIPEPDNPWDRNAVAVYIGGRKVGYLPRETSGQYAALLGRLWATTRGRAVCRAVVGGGRRELRSQVGTVSRTDEDQFGVRLALAAPERFDVTQSLRQLTAEELAEGPPPL